MYYFLYGKNNKEARKKLKSLVETLHEKRPDAEIFRVTSEQWNENQLDELLIAQGLFDQKYIIIFDCLFEYKDIKEKIQDSLSEMKESLNVFLILEGDVDAKTLQVVSKYAEKVQEFNGETKKVERFNTFALADAFGMRNKKNLWVLYMQALREGISSEEIAGILFWQIKNLMIVQKTKTIKESKLSPFVDSKARTFLKNFSEAEISLYADSIVEATAKVRQGEGEMEILLERIMLGI